VRYYGQWMRDQAEKRIGHLYPKAKLADGSEATVIAWLWARTVRSPDPAAKGAMVPLVSSFMLSTKEGKKAWVEPVIDASARNGWRFEVRKGALSKVDEERLKLGTKSGKAQAFRCLLTGSVIERGYVQAQGKLGRLDQRLIVLVCDAGGAKVFLAATDDHEATARDVDRSEAVTDARGSFLSQETPSRAMITGGVCSAYGLSTWGSLFGSRPLLALTTFSDLAREVRAKVEADFLNAASAPDVGEHLRDGGAGARAYGDALSTYLAFAVDKCADYWTSLATWMPRGTVGHMFSRQGFAPTFDFPEANPFSSINCNWIDATTWVAKSIEPLGHAAHGKIFLGDAAQLSYQFGPHVFSTDPPYYDNISYAVVADFLYVWLRRSLAAVWPAELRRLATPKDEELIASPIRHGSRENAEQYFLDGMRQTFAAIATGTAPIWPVTIYYAFKQSEQSESGITSAGWATFLQAVLDAGLSIDGTWPLRTERSARSVGQGANALASSIVLVCRKRLTDADVITRADFIRALKREMPTAIDAIRKAGVGPVDMQQSVIGPGMGVFSRYAKVLEDDDSAMPVKTALSLINRVWEEIENELDTNFDAETQVALAWFATYGFDAKPSGELITLANAKNIPLGTLFASGVFADGKGKAGLTTRADLPDDWSPASDKALTVWECVQHTARVLNAEDGGGEAAARLVAEMGAKAADARALAYRLYEIASQKGWAAEALIYNELAQEWPKLEELAATAGARSAAADAQASLF
jgi:putative DNA methylase